MTLIDRVLGYFLVRRRFDAHLHASRFPLADAASFDARLFEYLNTWPLGGFHFCFDDFASMLLASIMLLAKC